MPSFGSLAETTVARTVVSPYLARTAPSAWRAILPVSRTRCRPPQSRATRWMSNIAIIFHVCEGESQAQDGERLAASVPIAVRNRETASDDPAMAFDPSVRPDLFGPGFLGTHFGAGGLNSGRREALAS